MIIDRNTENYRSVTIGSYEIGIERRDPHGFWFVTWKSGSPPEVLSSAYTNLDKVYEDIENWFNKLPKTKKAA